MPRFSKEFRTRMLQRLTGPGALSAAALAREVGLSHSTLSAWLREARTLDGMSQSVVTSQDSSVDESVPTTTPTASQEPHSPQEMLRLLALADSLQGDELGAFLRREGVHSAQMETWRATVLEALRGRAPQPASSPVDRKRIAELERELERKEKALAEAAALLLLQKKLRLYLGGEDERIHERNER